jgi:hypothetical protein
MTFRLVQNLLAAAGLAALLTSVHAQTAPADAPAGTTVQCKDGSYAANDTKKGACRGHKGIKTWFGKAESSAKAEAAPAAPSAKPASAAAPAPTEQAGKASASGMKGKTARADVPQAAGGGAGKVWANDSTKVYHCMGDRYYGKTKKGEYMSEADAKAKGMHAARNKACTS